MLTDSHRLAWDRIAASAREDCRPALVPPELVVAVDDWITKLELLNADKHNHLNGYRKAADEDRAEIRRLIAERDAITNLLVERSIVANHELYDVLLPDKFSPLGFSWTQDVETKSEAFEMVRRAAGLEIEKGPSL